MSTQPVQTPAVRKRVAKLPQFQDLIAIQDLTSSDVSGILDLASRMKAGPASFRTALAGAQLALFFEKPSLRTRLT
ncbi:MAG: ornithine carbamoyltransferase, partial [Acidobacteriota bacterium]|nr:ornithine carbamoyltransferase [Acidobacteriota bacterium]